MFRRLLAIVGAGPAGCSAAISSAHIHPGVEVLLLEAGGVDKDKPCGDALVPEALDALSVNGIGEVNLKSHGAFPYDNVIASHKGKGSRQYPMAPRAGVLIRRAILDQLLRKRANLNCEIRYETTVKDIHANRSGFMLTVVHSKRTELIHADSVLLATGSIGNLAERYGISGCPKRAVAITQYSMNHRLSPALRFDFSPSLLPGYVWWFPIGRRGANWGVWTLTDRASLVLPIFRDRMRRLTEYEGYSPLRSGPARLWSNRGRNWHTSTGMLSCGDAAGLVDPFNGEGISAALLSGYNAGLAASSFLEGNIDALNKYSDWVRSFFSKIYHPDEDRARFWMDFAQTGRDMRESILRPQKHEAHSTLQADYIDELP